MSAASKEKERARNRRAQKRFREREKERQEERQGALSVLETQLAKCMQEKDELARKVLILEQSGLQKDSKKFETCGAIFDGDYFVEAQTDNVMDLLPTLTVGPELRTLTHNNLAKMSFPEYSGIYKTYVESLQSQLMNSSTLPNNERIIQLLHELCDLNMNLAMHNNEFGKWVRGRLDGAKPSLEPAPPSVWHRCLGVLQLSAEQKQALLASRKDHLQRLAPLLSQRWQLHRILGAAQPQDLSDLLQCANYLKVVETVDRLRSNLQMEQALLVQTMCASQQQFLAPQQTALNVVMAYPFYPNAPMLVNLLASMSPGELTAGQILGFETLPPTK